jgi:NADH-quinone oxidoreductase subunit G
MALGDYSNSRGASDFGLMPHLLPGYASVTDAAALHAFGKIWGATLPANPGLNARGMMDAAAKGDLHALYVVGANPVKTFEAVAGGRGKLDLLVVQDLFLTETAMLADIVLPAASAYEKNGTITNTAGEVQPLRKGAEVMGTRTDFDILRILAHKLALAGLGQPIPLRTPEAAFEEIRKAVSGYNVSVATLLLGEAGQTAPLSTTNGATNFDVPIGSIFSSYDTLFTSGTLGRYCPTILSLPEAEASR